ncbi:MAG: tRNA pseudouridine(38-40) synthase TruA [Chitinispirillaceae bacterium]|jgi:tRNA pseudouridine38-40 synthase|nr:tRNA pseudouridine(38-40) synthase TruA [Chitinispirillaceae bacterium]
MRLFFRVEYDGTAYSGWQHQKNAVGIQDMLEQAFSIVMRAPCKVTGAGRTDAGVHARRQGAHVDTAVLPDCRHVERAVNGVLPRDIAIHSLQPVAETFHARFSARSRRYCYRIATRKSPLLWNRTWTMLYPVDWNRVSDAASVLPGTHDFRSFCASGSGVSHARCTVTHAGLEDQGDSKVFTIEANRFVYNMVRSLVGTLIDIGRGQITDSFGDILAGRDRRRAGTSAPAWGLVLDNVFYQEVD